MKNHWLEQAKQRLQEEAKQASDAPFERLKALGMINQSGEVTGHLHRWDAFLAITGIRPALGSPQIEAFRCLKPVWGMPGGATIDISRQSMINYLKEGKKIITARRDEKLDLWQEGCDVRLSPNGFIVCESAENVADNVGDLPEIGQLTSRL